MPSLQNTWHDQARLKDNIFVFSHSRTEKRDFGNEKDDLVSIALECSGAIINQRHYDYKWPKLHTLPRVSGINFQRLFMVEGERRKRNGGILMTNSYDHGSNSHKSWNNNHLWKVIKARNKNKQLRVCVKMFSSKKILTTFVYAYAFATSQWVNVDAVSCFCR